jgi:putrescine transport system substrate-binding protein
MLQPEVIAKCTNFTNYANANLAARSPSSIPPCSPIRRSIPMTKVKQRLWAPKPQSEEQDREITRIWQTIKSG